ncbi:MAG: bacillithiol biosynthesis cysteine-adding enzyme BshC [Saprospiraceae bacterium]
MHKTLVPFSSITQLAKTDIAYSGLDSALRPFYRLDPSLENFSKAIDSRKAFQVPREILVAALLDQYRDLPEAEGIQDKINSLLLPDTFTVTTAHQPSLLLGPLYFVYKAISTINLAETVQKSTGKRIVPIFVLGSEDHDLDELNHIRLFNKEIRWEPGLSGPVGEMPSNTLVHVLQTLRDVLGQSDSAQRLFQKIEQCYTGHKTFAEATQALLHTFLGKYGLVVLNMSIPALKRHFVPIMQDELVNQTSNRLVSQTIEQLTSLGFKGQAAPREINLFYLQQGSRERIVLENGQYKVLNSSLVFDKAQILRELDEHPERFSPNVVLRPLFQEMILPNLAYVGGGGELAYWLERVSLFDHYGLPYPILVRRNSVLWFDKDAAKRSLKFGFAPTRFFEETETLIRAFIESQGGSEVNFSKQIVALELLYNELANKAQLIDPTLVSLIRAEEVKAVAQMQHLEGRLVRAEKQKHEVAINQLRGLKEKLFPGNSLQERTDNFIPYYLKYGDQFFETLQSNLDPLESGFVVLEEENN